MFNIQNFKSLYTYAHFKILKRSFSSTKGLKTNPHVPQNFQVVFQRKQSPFGPSFNSSIDPGDTKNS